MMNTGDRVTVTITDPSSYAMGAAASLNGKRGKVERTRVDPLRGEMALVEFDESAEKWWSNQLPVEPAPAEDGGS